MNRDGILRAVTTDGGFRVVAASTTEMVRGALGAQQPPSDTANLYADFLTASVLVRESMSPDHRMQVFLQGNDKKSRLVADSFPSGITRGLVQLRSDRFEFGGAGVLQVQRTLQSGDLHTGVVGIKEGASISDAFMDYMQDSEQIVTMMSVASIIKDGQVVAAGGYLLQLLPEVDRMKLAVMTERLEDFRDIRGLLEEGKASPEALIEETLYGIAYEQVAERDVSFGCTCDEVRLTASLATLPKADIEELMSSDKPLEITCDFCRKEYVIQTERLRGLLSSN